MSTGKIVGLINALGGSPSGGGGLPTGGEPFKQLVTDVDGNTVWADRLAYETTQSVVVLQKDDGVFNPVEEGLLYDEFEAEGFSLTVGNVYDVLFNDIWYKGLVAWQDEDVIVLGAQYASYTEELPFNVVYDPSEPDYAFVHTSDNYVAEDAYTLIVAEVQVSVHTIDPKFIPAPTQILFYAKRENSGMLVTNFLYKDERFEDAATPAEVSAALSTGNVYINDPRSSHRWLRPVYVSNEYSNERSYYIEIGCIYEFEADSAVDAIVFSMSASDK